MTSTATSISAWFAGRLPAEWTAAGDPVVTVDRDEVTVVLTIPSPELSDDASDADRSEAVAGRIAGFREDTRDQRITVARDAEHRFERKVAWGVTVGDGDDARSEMFTQLAVPAMTRLRQPERIVLDTLVAANVARSRADALAWCVRLVGDNVEEWLDELRTAMADVERIRDNGPG